MEPECAVNFPLFPNQSKFCTSRGTCVNGTCVCDEGWTGTGGYVDLQGYSCHRPRVLLVLLNMSVLVVFVLFWFYGVVVLLKQIEHEKKKLGIRRPHTRLLQKKKFLHILTVLLLEIPAVVVLVIRQILFDVSFAKDGIAVSCYVIFIVSFSISRKSDDTLMFSAIAKDEYKKKQVQKFLFLSGFWDFLAITSVPVNATLIWREYNYFDKPDIPFIIAIYYLRMLILLLTNVIHCALINWIAKALKTQSELAGECDSHERNARLLNGLNRLKKKAQEEIKLTKTIVVVASILCIPYVIPYSDFQVIFFLYRYPSASLLRNYDLGSKTKVSKVGCATIESQPISG